MIFTETILAGVYLIEPQILSDNRGFFARVFCEDEFAEQGLLTHFVQSNISFNARKGTLRGMHYQVEPHGEVKLVRCTMGAIYDIILDLRPDSPTFKQWVAFELSAKNRRMLYIPAGIAHGFQTLTDNSEVFYMMGEFYHPESARGVRWNDPIFGIDWPGVDERIISEKDQNWSDFNA
ncbi:MAG: dTDP-4-dehydrorhamnose 3,5-epimerase [Anaerolineae bacterium]|nr:dTDP-4-dehydrorhamnose 3,5-epimerase [Anaerolineae bacterium]